MNQCLDLVLLASPSAAFLQLFIFGPYIFNFLVKFVSPSSSTTRISPGQHPDNAGTSCLIILWTLSILCKGTLRSSVYSPFDILYGSHPQWWSHWRPPKPQGRPPTTSWAGDVLTPQDPGKVFCHITWETLERYPPPWAFEFIPICQEMRYRLKIA